MSPNGDRLYIKFGGSLHTTARQYDLGTNDDISTSVLNNTKFFTFPAGSGAGAIGWNGDGTKLYYQDEITGTDILEYDNAGIAYDLDTGNTLVATRTLTAAELGVSVIQPTDFKWKADGTKYYMLDKFNFSMYQFSAGTAYDITTLTYDSVSIDLTSCSLNTKALWWGPTGEVLLFLADIGDKLFQFNLDAEDVAADIGKPSTEIFKRGGEVRKTVTVIKDLWCLEGLETVLFFDGSQEPNQTVTNGEITVADGRAIARAAIGLPYTCDIELLDIEVGSGTASTPQTLQTKLKKITKVGVRFYKSRMPQVGPRSDHLIQMRPRQFEKFDQASQLVSGDATVIIKPSWNSNGRIFFRQCDPVPLTILAVFPDMVGEDNLD